jgi:hypothetical protein
VSIGRFKKDCGLINGRFLVATTMLEKKIISPYQGPMKWSQFSAIFPNFRRKNWRFSYKPMFFHQLAVF